MLSSDHFAILNDDMLVYLEYEAQRRNVTIQRVYEEEAAAEKRSRAKALNRRELKIIARDNKPDPRYFDDDNPF